MYSTAINSPWARHSCTLLIRLPTIKPKGLYIASPRNGKRTFRKGRSIYLYYLYIKCRAFIAHIQKKPDTKQPLWGRNKWENTRLTGIQLAYKSAFRISSNCLTFEALASDYSAGLNTRTGYVVKLAFGGHIKFALQCLWQESDESSEYCAGELLICWYSWLYPILPQITLWGYHCI